MCVVVALLPVIESAIHGCVAQSRKTTIPSCVSATRGIPELKASEPSSDLHSTLGCVGTMPQDQVELEFCEKEPAGLEEPLNGTGRISKQAYGVERPYHILGSSASSM